MGLDAARTGRNRIERIGIIGPARPVTTHQRALLQGNIDQGEKFDTRTGLPKALAWYSAHLADPHASAARSTDTLPLNALVVAPETALPLLPQQAGQFQPPVGRQSLHHRHHSPQTAAVQKGHTRHVQHNARTVVLRDFAHPVLELDRASGIDAVIHRAEQCDGGDNAAHGHRRVPRKLLARARVEPWAEGSNPTRIPGKGGRADSIGRRHADHRIDVAALRRKYQVINIKLDKAGGLTEALALRDTRKNAPTAVLTHGANPGLISHWVKQALINIARDLHRRTDIPKTREQWAELAMKLGATDVVDALADRDRERGGRSRLGEDDGGGNGGDRDHGQNEDRSQRRAGRGAGKTVHRGRLGNKG